jgi:nigerose phosphorylase
MYVLARKYVYTFLQERGVTHPYTFSDGWLITDQPGYNLDHEVSKATVFALANGYMSSRGTPDHAPLGRPGVVGHHINGIYDSPTGDILQREMINIPAWTPIRLDIEEETGELVDYARTLDMRQGLLRQTARWRTANGITATVTSERLVSLDRPHLALIRWQLQTDQTCRVTIRSAIDARVTNRFAATHFAASQAHADFTRSQVEIVTIEQQHRVLVMADHQITGVASTLRWKGESSTQWAANECRFVMRPDMTATLTKYIAVYDSRFAEGNLTELARGELAAARAAGYTALRAEHARRWADLWAESDVVITGDDEAQIALRFSLFHLLANAPHSDRVSISARGLQGQDYWGSIFWDCDIYVLPFFTYTQPDYARRCLLYRYHTLDGARRKARGLDFEGAYYAWQSQETGDETCALYVFDNPLTGEKIRSYFADEQIHISADVVYALWQYVRATNDLDFLADYGLEIACEVARFFAARSTHNAALDRYELRTVLGPDEYHERVDNNAYTNALARYSLEIALAALDQIRVENPTACDRLRNKIALEDDEIARWRAVAAGLYVPDAENGLIAQFDGYFDLEDAPPDVVRTRLAHPDLHPGGPLGPYQATQAIKQADVILLLYLLRDRYSQAITETNWRYYEPRTAHDSSLSPLAYALVAADVGLTEWAYRYFLHTAMLDMLGTGPHWNLGVHTAAMGGAWLAVAHGFCQLDLRTDGVHLLGWPRLPEQWQRVSLPFVWHGQPVRLSTDGQTTTLSADTGPVPVVYPGGKAMLKPGGILTLEHK